MNFKETTRRYEKWMHGCGSVVNAELRDKHAKMKQDPFLFLRGTYYRWAELWPEICPDSKRAPVILSVADLHVDSFGTWRDIRRPHVLGRGRFRRGLALALYKRSDAVGGKRKSCKNSGRAEN